MKPTAKATVSGGRDYPDIHGTVSFYEHSHGTVVVAEIYGLPRHEKSPIFGFHIHEGSHCTGTAFADTGGHFDTRGRAHPYHTGDMPPLFGVGGYAFGSFLTDRFGAHDIIGKTVVIHSMPDDFTTQPSGNAGEKIACGEIVRA